MQNLWTCDQLWPEHATKPSSLNNLFTCQQLFGGLNNLTRDISTFGNLTRDISTFGDLTRDISTFGDLTRDISTFGLNNLRKVKQVVNVNTAPAAAPVTVTANPVVNVVMPPDDDLLNLTRDISVFQNLHGQTGNPFVDAIGDLWSAVGLQNLRKVKQKVNVNTAPAAAPVTVTANPIVNVILPDENNEDAADSDNLLNLLQVVRADRTPQVIHIPQDPPVVSGATVVSPAPQGPTVISTDLQNMFTLVHIPQDPIVPTSNVVDLSNLILF
jgi:hypothetical protein